MVCVCVCKRWHNSSRPRTKTGAPRLAEGLEIAVSAGMDASFFTFILILFFIVCPNNANDSRKHKKTKEDNARTTGEPSTSVSFYYP